MNQDGDDEIDAVAGLTESASRLSRRDASRRYPFGLPTRRVTRRSRPTPSLWVETTAHRQGLPPSTSGKRARRGNVKLSALLDSAGTLRFR